jgi:hypothetical protein
MTDLLWVLVVWYGAGGMPVCSRGFPTLKECLEASDTLGRTDEGYAATPYACVPYRPNSFSCGGH